MPVNVKQISNKPIIVVSFESPLANKLTPDVQESLQDRILDIVKTTPGIDYVIMDLSSVELSFMDLATGLVNIRDRIKQMGGKDFVDANMRFLLVGPGNLVDLAVMCAGGDRFGNIDVQHFHTLEAALDYAQANLGV